MAEFELSAAAVDEHARALGGIAQAVHGAAVGAVRLGAMDFGALFAASLTPAVNAALGVVGDAVRRHGREIEQHRDEFVRTAAALVAADEAGAVGIRPP